MTAPLSNDLRLRVVRAVEGGLSRRTAAGKFDVSIASAVRWHQRYKRAGSVEPDAIGGDRHSHRAEAHAARMARLYGRSRRGERCRAGIPHGHWKTTTLVAGLSTDGIIAPTVLDGAMDGEMFSAYVKTLLAPYLRPGDIVIAATEPVLKTV